MDQSVEKRKKVSLSKEESEILQWLFIKAIIPIVVIVMISSTVLFFGLQFLMKKVSFGNYGIMPSSVEHNVSQFISTYMVISLTNVLLMIALSVIVLYLVLHDLIMPILRITREVKECVDHKKNMCITVRQADRIFQPLVHMINKIKI